METVFGLVITFVMLMFSIYKGIFIGYPLLISFFIFVIISLRKGYSIAAISKMAYDGGKKSFVVLKIFILIGAITAVWMSSGTVPSHRRLSSYRPAFPERNRVAPVCCPAERLPS